MGNSGPVSRISPVSRKIIADQRPPQLVVCVGEEPIKADVVFVHGLLGDRVKTWTKERDDGQAIYWPQDLLPVDNKNIRVISVIFATLVYEIRN
jgi:hypothetical protein